MYTAPIQATIDELLHKQAHDPEWDGPTRPDLIWWSAASWLHDWAAATVVIYPLERERLRIEISPESFEECTEWAQLQLDQAAAVRIKMMAAGSPLLRSLGADDDERSVLHTLMHRPAPDPARVERENAIIDNDITGFQTRQAIAEGFDHTPVMMDDFGLTADEFDASLYGLDPETYSDIAAGGYSDSDPS